MRQPRRSSNLAHISGGGRRWLLHSSYIAIEPKHLAHPVGTRAPRILYVSYDGALEPLGESQVVSYLERLASDHKIVLLTFEKPQDLADRSHRAAMERRLTAAGLEWIPLGYHKNPPVISTAFDIVRGILCARRVCRRRDVQVLHARSYVPAVIALGARRASHAAFLFDMRGFWVDEKVEAGHWRAGGALYRIGKWWERRFFRSAGAIVSLTDAGVRALPTLGYQVPSTVPVQVIPTCVDLERFAPGLTDPELSAALGLTGSCVIGTVGTMSNWYMRDEMLRYLAYLARALDNVRVLIVTREGHEALRLDARAAGVPLDRLVVTRATFAEMPRYVSLFDAGVFFIRPALSKRASAATKLAEFLACGVPVIINDGVGDSGTIVKERGVGMVLPALDSGSFERSLPHVRSVLADPMLRDRCRQVAADLFDLERGVERYRRLYQQLSA